MNFPNTLTLFRFVLIPIYLWAFYGVTNEHKVGALLILLLAGLTDVLDGYIARRNGSVTQAGQLLDPLADKLLMVAVLFSLIQSHRVSWVVAGLLVLRDASMIIGATFFYFQGKRAVPKANRWGKITTVLYYITICSVILAWPGHVITSWLLGITLVFSYFAMFVYVMNMELIDMRHRVL